MMSISKIDSFIGKSESWLKSNIIFFACNEYAYNARFLLKSDFSQILVFYLIFKKNTFLK